MTAMIDHATHSNVMMETRVVDFYCLFTCVLFNYDGPVRESCRFGAVIEEEATVGDDLTSDSIQLFLDKSYNFIQFCG